MKKAIYSPWIQTTYKCNLSCDYCYLHGNKDMSNEVYTQISKMYKPEETHIRIAGGEPLLVFEKWKDFALKYNSVEVLTNFQYVPKYFYDYNFRVSISIDGYGGKPLSKKIKEKIKKLKIQPWIMTTFMNQDITEIAKYVSTNNYGWAISTDYFIRKIDLKISLSKLKESIEILKKNNYNFDNLIFNNICGYLGKGCRAGDTMVSIDIDGKIYRCQTELGKNPIGDVWNGYEKEKRNNKCNNCVIDKYCTGWCPLHHVKNGDVCELMKIFVWEVYYAK